MSSGTTNLDANSIAELQRTRRALKMIETDNPTDMQKSDLAARHNKLVDFLWKQHTTHLLDPVKYFPIEIVNSIFSFVVCHVGDLESEGSWGRWVMNPASSEIIAGYLDGPLNLASVSRYWCHIATTHAPLWSTILIDQSEGDCMEQIQLFLDRSGKELLDIILLDHRSPTAHLKGFLRQHAERVKTVVALSSFRLNLPNPAQVEPLETHVSTINWDVYTQGGSRIPTVPIPKCLRHVQLYHSQFNFRSLIQFTDFHNLESLSIEILFESENIQRDKVLRFELLRHLRLKLGISGSKYPWIEWLECPALMDLDLVYTLRKYPSNKTYTRLEACLLRFRSLQNLRVHMDCTIRRSDRVSHIEAFHFDGSLNLVQLTFNDMSPPNSDGTAALIERFFSVFVPNTHIIWPYGHFPSSIIFYNLKFIHISNQTRWDRSALVASGPNQMVFPFLEELYLEDTAPNILNHLRAPRLISLRISGSIPLDLRHLSNSAISFHLKFGKYGGLREIYLPPAIKLQLDLPATSVSYPKLHTSRFQAVAINISHWEDIELPPIWTPDYVASIWGIVTYLNIESQLKRRPWYLAQTIPSFLKPFVYLKHLKLFWEVIGSAGIDQLAQRLTDPDFLPELESLTISEYPSWPHFFRCIQQRQSGFLSGEFRTRLEGITFLGPVHVILLDYLRESLAGRYTSIFNMPPRRKGSKDWPPLPFRGIHTNGLLCCYICHKAGLEIGCTISPSENAEMMLICSRHRDRINRWRRNTVFAL